MVEKTNKLPIERIASNLDGNLVELRKALGKFNGKTLPNIDTTLQDMSATLKSATATLAEDSPQRVQLSQTLDDPGRMTRSMRELADYLKRNPESLVRGRADDAHADALQPSRK